MTRALLLETPAPEAPILHGGRLDAARRAFPQAPLPWVDLSTGVSPRPYPLPELPSSVWTRLPDEGAFAAAEAAAARAYRAPAHLETIAGPGTQAFIQLLPRLFPARRVGVLGFTYAEHAAAWRAAGAQVFTADSLDALAAADAAVVVNPNNPDGRLAPPRQLAALAGDMAGRGGLLVVDEAFADFAPQASVLPHAPARGLIVLRSFGKAYGLPGVRLGFALCGRDLAAPLRAALGPWSVSGPALALGATALADVAWRAARAVELQQDAARLDALLSAAGFEIIGGTALFRLASRENAGAWFERLARRGVLTRSFAERPQGLRFGLPASEAEWGRLAEALEGA